MIRFSCGAGPAVASCGKGNLPPPILKIPQFLACHLVSTETCLFYLNSVMEMGHFCPRVLRVQLLLLFVFGPHSAVLRGFSQHGRLLQEMVGDHVVPTINPTCKGVPACKVFIALSFLSVLTSSLLIESCK